MALEYLKIEENTEVLSQVVRYNLKNKKTPLKFQAAINIRTFMDLVVQVSYLLYTCSVRGVNLFISKEIYAMPPRKHDIGIIQLQ